MILYLKFLKLCTYTHRSLQRSHIMTFCNIFNILLYSYLEFLILEKNTIYKLISLVLLQNNEEDLSLKHPQNEDGSKIDEDTLLVSICANLELHYLETLSIIVIVQCMYVHVYVL